MCCLFEAGVWCQSFVGGARQIVLTPCCAAGPSDEPSYQHSKDTMWKHLLCDKHRLYTFPLCLYA